MLIFYKTIDKSVFTSGFAIPVMYKDMLFDNLGFTLAHGEKVQIDILIDDCIYKATLMNIDFDQKAHPNHKDILQVRYGANSPLAKKLREKFGYTESLINSNSNVYSYKWLSSLPEDQKAKLTDKTPFEPYKSKYRKRGTGCVYMINDHLWEGKYSPRDAHGNRISRNVYGKTKEECEEKLAELIRQMKEEIENQKAKLQER